MALLTFHLGVFAIQRIPGKFVVKLFDRNFPVDQVEIHSVVLEMAVHTILTLWILHLQSGVITMFFRKGLGDFFMALQALEGGRFCPKFVTTRALRCTRKALMGA